jgi:hypothetical protein
MSRIVTMTAAAAVLLFIDLGAMAQAQVTAGAPDLVPVPSKILQGTVSVKNVGSADAGAFVVTVQCQKQGGGGCAEHPGFNKYEDPAYPNRLVVKVSGLKKGKTFNHKLPFWKDLVWAPGNYNFLVEADPGKKVGETNEGNNIAGAVLHK